jgi:hypothetical protein
MCKKVMAENASAKEMDLITASDVTFASKNTG